MCECSVFQFHCVSSEHDLNKKTVLWRSDLLGDQARQRSQGCYSQHLSQRGREREREVASKEEERGERAEDGIKVRDLLERGPEERGE